MIENPYKSPEPYTEGNVEQKASLSLFRKLTIAFQYLLWVGLFPLLRVIVPTFVDDFAENDLELSSATLLLISLSQLVANYWLVTLILLLILPSLSFLVLSRKKSDKPDRLGIRFFTRAVTIVPIVFYLLAFVSLLFPLLKMNN